MSNKTNFNLHNQNIRAQGGYAPWIADIHDELYQNIDNTEIAQNNQQSQINNIISTDLPSKQNALNDHEQRLNSNTSQIAQILNTDLPNKQNIINDHESRIQAQQNNINTINNDLSNKQNQINQILTTEIPEQKNKTEQQQQELYRHAEKIREFDEKIKTFNKESINLLGQHFKQNYDDLNKEKDAWLVYLKWSFVALFFIEFGLSILTITESFGFALKHSYLLIPVSIVLGTIVYFISSQYSQYKKLAMDYRNRQIVAMSYLGVLNNSEGEERNTITSIVADTLFSRNITDQSSDLPVKEAMRIGERMLDAGVNIAKKSG
jgi:cation transport ATPase